MDFMPYVLGILFHCSLFGKGMRHAYLVDGSESNTIFCFCMIFAWTFASKHRSGFLGRKFFNSWLQITGGNRLDRISSFAVSIFIVLVLLLGTAIALPAVVLKWVG